jgi:hypothetical protein
MRMIFIIPHASLVSEQLILGVVHLNPNSATGLVIWKVIIVYVDELQQQVYKVTKS